MAYVQQHFEEVATSEERAGLGALPGGVLRDLLASDELHAQSEQQVLEVLGPGCPHLSMGPPSSHASPKHSSR